MRMRGYTSIAAAGVAALMLATNPGAGGQERPPLPPQAAVAPAPAEAPCPPAVPEVRHLVELQHELNATLGRLKAELAQEEEMQPQDLAKLQQLREALANAPLLSGSDQEDLLYEPEALAQEAAQVAPEEAQAWILDSEEGSGWVGVQVSDISADKAKELKLPAVRGVLVVEVEKDSPASKAGLKVNDVIAEYDHQPVEGVTQFRRQVRETPPGRTIPITVWRDGGTQSLSIEIGDRGRMMMRSMPRMREPLFGNPRAFDFSFTMPEFYFGATPMLGINAEDLNGQLGAYFGAPGDEGILVREVRAGSPAEKGGLKAGDVITKVDEKAVSTVDQLREQLRDKREQKSVKLGVIRKGSPLSIEVQLELPKPVEHTHVTRRAVL